MGSTGTVHTVYVKAEQLLDVMASALRRHGASPEDAQIQAAHLVEAELRGHPSHGARRLEILIERLKAGLILSDQRAHHSWASPSALSVDGRRGFGPVVAYEAIEAILPRALETGVAIAVIRNSNHLGMLSPYTERATDAHAIAIILTTSEGLVHPWGGAGALIGTNPIAIGVPSPNGDVSLDMSTASVSMGKILDHADRGIPIPQHWAVDAEGHPTTDAAAAAGGAVAPFGGSKGYALGLAFEALVGLLTHTSFGVEITGTLDAIHPTTKGDVIIIISPDAFNTLSNESNLADYLEQIRSSGIDGAQVFIPGDRARQAKNQRLRKGVKIDSKVWQRAVNLAEDRTVI